MSTKNKNIQNDDTLLDCIKSKYILTNTVKTIKIDSKLTKTINNITGNKSIIGYDDIDYDNIEKLCNQNNTNLFVKNNATFNNISLNNSLFLKNEIINDIYLINYTITSLNYKNLLNNILSSILNSYQEQPSIIFNSTQNNINSGLLSANKHFIVSDNVISAFILVYIIYSKSKILCLKPVLDTFILIDSSENIIKIGDYYSEINNSDVLNKNNDSSNIENMSEPDEFITKEDINNISDLDISFFEIIK